jgi:hypothetical protein
VLRGDPRVDLDNCSTVRSFLSLHALPTGVKTPPPEPPPRLPEDRGPSDIGPMGEKILPSEARTERDLPFILLLMGEQLATA